MADMTTYLRDALANHVLRSSGYPCPTSCYAGLFTSPTGADGSGTEVSGGGYARASVTFGPPVDGCAANTAVVCYGPATQEWGTVTHMALFDAVSGGHMLMHAELDVARTVGIGDEAQFGADDLSVTFG